MSEGDDMAGRNRAQILSVALVGAPTDVSALDRLNDLLAPLRRDFEFVEILFVDHIGTRAASADLIGRIPDCRFVWVDDMTSDYAMRAVAANEAIGDRIWLSSSDGFGHAEVMERFVAPAAADLVFFRDRRGVGSGVFRMLSSLSSYDIDPSYARDVLITRAGLERINALNETRLAFRFPSRSHDDTSTVLALKKPKRDPRPLRKRLELLGETMFSSIGSIFLGLSVLSAASVLFGLAYLIYAVAVMLSQFSVQPGWFSTSVVLSLFTIVFGLFVFSCSIFFVFFSKRILRTAEPDYRVIALDDGLRLFSKLTSESNVSTVDR